MWEQLKMFSTSWFKARAFLFYVELNRSSGFRRLDWKRLSKLIVSVSDGSSQLSDTRWEAYMLSTLILIRNGHGWYKGMYMSLSTVKLVQNSRITPTYFTFPWVNFQLILTRIYFGLRWIECFFFPWKFKRKRVSSWTSYPLIRCRKQTFTISYCASWPKKNNQTNTHTKIVRIKLQIFKSLRRGFEISLPKDDELHVISPFCNVLSPLDLLIAYIAICEVYTVYCKTLSFVHKYIVVCWKKKCRNVP